MDGWNHNKRVKKSPLTRVKTTFDARLRTVHLSRTNRRRCDQSSGVRVSERVGSVPARFGDDHLRADVVKALPQVRALQLHLNLLHGGRG